MFNSGKHQQVVNTLNIEPLALSANDISCDVGSFPSSLNNQLFLYSNDFDLDSELCIEEYD